MFLLFFTDYKLKGFQQRNILQQKIHILTSLSTALKFTTKLW